MITEKELNEGILQCTAGEPTPQKMIRLAAYYSIRDRLFGGETRSDIPQDYSTENKKIEKHYTCENYLISAYQKNAEKAAAIMDEVMQAVKMLQPKMYESTMKKLNDL